MAGHRHVSVHVGDYFGGDFGSSGHGGSHVSVNVGNRDDCSYERDRWEDTGRRYWKRRYYECRGWW